ncbi:MAG TPA: hypothetical protein VNN79_11115, partial [Actinomycetota bacterium]|nr:hypothetical protein [Actinomycetota bacterium]
MRRAAVRLAIVVSTIAAAFGAAAPEAGAHGNGVIIVPRQLAGRPAPHLDASCESDYRRSGNARPILYRPRYDGPPATVSLITTAYDLWVCIQGLSRRPNGSTTDPYVSLVFDTDHNGGAAPDGHDINLALSEDGTRTEYRGNGTGFVPQPFPSLWSARTDRSQEVTWNAEFSIDLT